MAAPEAEKVYPVWVRVIEERPVSLQLARLVEVLHESPQAILIVEGRAVWHDSHRAITVEALRSAVARLG